MYYSMYTTYICIVSVIMTLERDMAPWWWPKAMAGSGSGAMLLQMMQARPWPPTTVCRDLVVMTSARTDSQYVCRHALMSVLWQKAS